MSIETAKEFLKKAQNDQALYDKLSAVEGDSEAAVKLGTELGFTFTAEDLTAATDEFYGELSDDELEAAAGGLGGKRPPIHFD